MPINQDNISTIRNTLSQPPNPIADIEQGISSALKDPFATVVTKVFGKINSLLASIQEKIDKLVEELIESLDSRGRISLEGNVIVITVTRQDVQQAQELSSRIMKRIASIQNLIVTLNTLIKSVQSIQKAMTVLQTALSIQEALLTLNPTTGPMFQVLKRGIQVLFLKDIVKEYLGIVKRQLEISIRSANQLTNKFKNLTVQIKIREEQNKGNYIDSDQAESLIAQQLLGEGVDSVQDTYEAPNGLTYRLKVEKYGDKQLIGRAYETYSGLLEEQTAPSFFSTPEDLIEELKSILNLIP